MLYIFHDMILMTVHHLFCKTITQHTPKWLELHYKKLLHKLSYLVYDVISRAGMKVKPCSSETFTPSSKTMLTKSNKPYPILICWISRTHSWICVLRSGCYQQTHTHTQILCAYQPIACHARSQNCEKRLWPSSRLPLFPSVRPPARVEQLGYTGGIFMMFDI
jgi:hypothetical protein